MAKEKVKNVHFTVCQKPWSCFKHDRNVACTPFLERWYELRNGVSERHAESKLRLGHGTKSLLLKVEIDLTRL